jgi:RimJ/RimL family protein N-acetyltransferase
MVFEMVQTTFVVKDFNAFRVDALYRLFEQVYGSADGMVESLAEKFPDMLAFAAKLAALREDGGVAVACGTPEAPLAYALIAPRKAAKLRHTAELSMGVAPGARGQGLGRQVLQAALVRALASPKIEIVYLMVREDNAPALALYEREGFERLAVLARDTRVGNAYFDGVLMRRFVAACG